MSNSVDTILSLADTYLAPNYGSRDLTLVRGEGAYVWDVEGRRYADLLAGLGVNNLGHCHPRVVEAIRQQAGELLHISNLYLNEPQIALAKLLVENSGADQVFFCNSGTEAVEAAIKVARRYSFDHFGEGRYEIVTLENSFHGRTMGAISATGQPKFHQGFEPILQGFNYVPINDIEAMKEAVNERTCAVMLEPVQGEGGVYPCHAEYLRQVRELCDEKNLLLIFDEIQCGLGRSGHLFASEAFQVEPEIITLSKSLAGGVPIGAMLAKKEVMKSLVPGTHAATFGGNPLSSAAGVAALQTLIEEELPQRSLRLGENFLQQLGELQQKHAQAVLQVRGLGLMIGVEMSFPVKDLLKGLREKGYIAGSAGPNVLRFLPPLIVEESLLEQVVKELDSLIPRFSNTE